MEFRDGSGENNGDATRISPRGSSGMNPSPDNHTREGLNPGPLGEDDWLAASSHELRRGMRISETTMDTLPGNLQDEFSVGFER